MTMELHELVGIAAVLVLILAVHWIGDL